MVGTQALASALGFDSDLPPFAGQVTRFSGVGVWGGSPEHVFGARVLSPRSVSLPPLANSHPPRDPGLEACGSVGAARTPSPCPPRGPLGCACRLKGLRSVTSPPWLGSRRLQDHREGGGGVAGAAGQQVHVEPARTCHLPDNSSLEEGK